MALGKRIKVGGGYYKGYKVAVSSASGGYTQVITETQGHAINSVSVTPTQWGSGDTWKLTHYADAGGTGAIIAVLAEDIHNIGKGSPVALDFPAAEQINANESLKFEYTNTASVAMDVYLIVESIGLQKTA